MKPVRQFLIPLLAFVSLLAGCAGFEFNNGQKTTQLYEGMNYAEVVTLLGEPVSSQQAQGLLKARWSLHVKWKGFVPYDLDFNAKTRKLVSWRANEEEYQRSQQQMQPIVNAIEASNKTNNNRGGSSGSGGSGSISNTANGTAVSGRDAEGRHCTSVSIPNGQGMMSCN